MNKSYTNMGEYIIVDTDNGFRKIEIYSNRLEMLEQENIIESLNNKIRKVKRDLKTEEVEYSKEMLKTKIKNILMTSIIFSLMTILSMISVFSVTKAYLPIEGIIKSVLYTLGLVVPTTLIPLVPTYFDYKNSEKRKEILEQEKEYLTSKIIEEKSKLVQLSKTKFDDVKLTTKNIEQQHYVDYINKVDEDFKIKVKSKSRFKK